MSSGPASLSTYALLIDSWYDLLLTMASIVPQSMLHETTQRKLLMVTMQHSTLSIIPSQEQPTWQALLSRLVTDPVQLAELLELDPSKRPTGLEAIRQFPLKVPLPFVEKMRKGDWMDPLLLQVWPCAIEETSTVSYVKDPLQESASNPVSGLLHKYKGRVLLTAAPHCAIHCRYCFRRHFDYDENSPSRQHWQHCFDYIAADSSIEEVILSGGDPLALSDKQLDWIITAIESISHVTTIRIHTRLPVVLPQRVTESLVNKLSHRKIKIVMVLHTNHRNEIDHEFSSSMSMLSTNGITLLNQSVLLAGVNDDSQTLASLSKKLFMSHVLPYYLHLPDEVEGTAHFDVELSRAQNIMKDLQNHLPGYLVPNLVKEEAGEGSKTRFY